VLTRDTDKEFMAKTMASLNSWVGGLERGGGAGGGHALGGDAAEEGVAVGVEEFVLPECNAFLRHVMTDCKF
jgi:hypothetical protein